MPSIGYTKHPVIKVGYELEIVIDGWINNDHQVEFNLSIKPQFEDIERDTFFRLPEMIVEYFNEHLETELKAAARMLYVEAIISKYPSAALREIHPNLIKESTAALAKRMRSRAKAVRGRPALDNPPPFTRIVFILDCFTAILILEEQNKEIIPSAVARLVIAKSTQKKLDAFKKRLKANTVTWEEVIQSRKDEDPIWQNFLEAYRKDPQGWRQALKNTP